MIKVKDKQTNEEYDAISIHSKLLETNIWYLYKNGEFHDMMTEMVIWGRFERVG